MNKQNLLSVIITTVEKDRKYLIQCLDSIHNSAKYANVSLEFIVIFNGTNSNIDVSRYSDHLFKIINTNNNIGLCKALNKGFREAKGEWCILACPDTNISLETIKILFYHVVEKNVAIISPKVIANNNNIQPTILPSLSLWQVFIEQSYLYKILPSIFKSSLSDKSLYSSYSYVNAVSTVFFLINKHIFREIGGFDERFFLFFNDTDLCKKIIDKGFHIAYDPTSTIFHFRHQSQGGEKDGNLYLNDLKRYLLKYHSKIYTICYLLIFRLGSFIRLLFWSIKIRSIQDRSLLYDCKKKIKYYKGIIYKQ